MKFRLIRAGAAAAWLRGEASIPIVRGGDGYEGTLKVTLYPSSPPFSPAVVVTSRSAVVLRRAIQIFMDADSGDLNSLEVHPLGYYDLLEVKLGGQVEFAQWVW
jgi:hypothetical protein